MKVLNGTMSAYTGLGEASLLVGEPPCSTHCLLATSTFVNRGRTTVHKVVGARRDHQEDREH